MNSDSDTEEPSPEALVRYLAMRRHTVGVGDSRLDAPGDLRIKLAHHQAVAAAMMRPMIMTPSNLLQQTNVPQVIKRKYVKKNSVDVVNNAQLIFSFFFHILSQFMWGRCFL